MKIFCVLSSTVLTDPETELQKNAGTKHSQCTENLNQKDEGFAECKNFVH